MRSFQDYLHAKTGEYLAINKGYKIWGPILEKTGVLTRDFEKEYRSHLQTFWKLNTDVFLEELNKYPKWPIEKSWS